MQGYLTKKKALSPKVAGELTMKRRGWDWWSEV